MIAFSNHQKYCFCMRSSFFCSKGMFLARYVWVCKKGMFLARKGMFLQQGYISIRFGIFHHISSDISSFSQLRGNDRSLVDLARAGPCSRKDTSWSVPRLTSSPLRARRTTGTTGATTTTLLLSSPTSSYLLRRPPTDSFLLGLLPHPRTPSSSDSRGGQIDERPIVPAQISPKLYFPITYKTYSMPNRK